MEELDQAALLQIALSTKAEIEAIHPKPWRISGYSNSVYFLDSKGGGEWIRAAQIDAYIKALEVMTENL